MFYKNDILDINIYSVDVMNFQQIDYILAVKDMGNFLDASESCHVTQSTLSTMIGRFEKEVGISIFDRHFKPVKVTKEGEILIQQLRIIKKEVETLAELRDSLKGELKGDVSIGVIPTIAPYILPGFLNNFAKQLPDLQFSVSETPTKSIVESLKKRELDIGILALPILDSDLIEIPLYHEPFVLYDCSNKPLPQSPTLSDIDIDRLWLMEEGHCLSQQVIQICDLDKNTNNNRMNFKFRAGSVDSLIRFVKMNEGVTLLPLQATEEFTKEERQRIRRFQSPEPSRSVGMIVHKHFVKQKLLEEISKQIKQKWTIEKPSENYNIPPFQPLS